MKELDESTIDSDPFKQFEEWFLPVRDCGIPMANAMTLSTVDKNNRPSARVVLLQSFNSGGFIFFTNYKSRKGKEIEQNPFACITFYWPNHQRQIRIDGNLNKVSETISDNYFMARPRGSQLGAWASPQSEIIVSRKFLEEKIKSVTEEFEGKEVSRPSWWGGYILVPEQFEFWQEGESRLHNRICYSKQNEIWKTQRLAP